MQQRRRLPACWPKKTTPTTRGWPQPYEGQSVSYSRLASKYSQAVNMRRPASCEISVLRTVQEEKARTLQFGEEAERSN